MVFDTPQDRHEYMYTMLRLDIAYQVRMLRAQRQLTQGQLAELCGISQREVSVIEDWDREFPNISTLKKIAEGLDIALVVRFEDWRRLFNTLIRSHGDDPYFKHVTTA